MIGAWKGLRAQFDRATTLLYIAHRLLEKCSGGRAGLVPYLLYAQPLGNPALASVKDDPQTQIARWQAGDARVSAFPRPPEVLAERWASGSRCYGAMVKGEVAGCIWIALNEHLEDEVRCRYQLPKDGVWDYDVLVLPRWRLGRTLARLWKAVDTDLASEQRRWSFSRISRFNRASIGAHERLGAQVVGRVTFLKLGPWQMSWQGAALLPHWDGRSGCPTLTLHAPSTP